MDVTRFLVLKAQNAGFLLSCEKSTRLGMLHVAALATTELLPKCGDYHNLFEKSPAAFRGEIGKLKDYQLELSIKPTVQPMQLYCPWYKTCVQYPHTSVLG